MKITDIKVNELKSPGGPNSQTFVGRSGKLLVRVFTDEGITGIAEGSRNLGVFRAYLDDLIKPLIIGMNPLQPKQITEILSLGTSQQATRFPSQIVGAIDIACWDITAKFAGLPLYSLLGGAHRIKIPLYWSRGNGWRKEPSKMLEEIQEGYEKGFRAFYKGDTGWIIVHTGYTSARGYLRSTHADSSYAGVYLQPVGCTCSYLGYRLFIWKRYSNEK